MAACCSTLSRAQFLEQKLKNFRAFVSPLCLTDDQKARLTEYDSVESVMPFLLQLVALKRSGTLAATLDSFAEDLKGDAAWRAKLGRYADMFCDVLTS